MIEFLVKLLMLFGASFLLIAGIGILRMPDIYMRASLTAKSITLGIGFLLLAVSLHFSDIGVTTRAVMVIAFFLLTSPVSAHMIGRAAYLIGVPMWKGTIVDELRDRYDLTEKTLASSDSPQQRRKAKKTTPERF